MGDDAAGDASGEPDDVWMDDSMLAGVVGLRGCGSVRKMDKAATGVRAEGAGAGAGVCRADEAGESSADPEPDAGDPIVCSPAAAAPRLPLLLPLLLSLSKLASISSEISSSASLPSGGDASSPAPLSRPAAATTDSGLAGAETSAGRAGEEATGDSSRSIGTKLREVFGDCLDADVWLGEAATGDVALEYAESNDDVAAW